MRLSPLTKRFAAITMLLVCLMSFWAVFMSPAFESVHADRERIAHYESQLAHYSDLASEANAMQDLLHKLESSSNIDRYLLVGHDPTLLAAQMQRTVQNLVSETGARTRSSQTIPVHSQNGLANVGVHMEVIASSPQLEHILYNIETSNPLLLIQFIDIEVPESGVPSGLGDDGQPELGIRLNLNAYAKLASGVTGR